MKRKPLSQLLRDGHATTGRLPLATHGYYTYRGAVLHCDPILLMFVGKFGTDIITSIHAEHRLEIYVEERQFDAPQVFERITKAVNGGLWELHRRLLDYPKLYSAMWDEGFRDPRRYTSVFRAVTFLNERRHTVEEIATRLEESRL